jgi:hypothetical protein
MPQLSLGEGCCELERFGRVVAANVAGWGSEDPGPKMIIWLKGIIPKLFNVFATGNHHRNVAC